jgi:cell division protein FtsA
VKRRGSTVAAIDVGTTKICTLIGDLDSEGALRVLGAGVTASRGVRRGVIDDMAEVTGAVLRSVDLAVEASGGVPITTAAVGLAGTHVSCLVNKGIVAVGSNRPIGPDDVSRALDSARTLAIPTNREIVHVLPRYFILDGDERVANPVGMFAHRLDVEAHVVTAAVSAMQNMKRAVTAANINVGTLVLEPLASADAVLDPEERRQGVILADIGGGTTDIAIILNNAVYHTAVIPLGGDTVTQDLVVGLRVPFDAAEEAKEVYGHALPSTVGLDETVQIDAFGSQGARTVSRRRVCEIVQARMEEILELIGAEVERAGLEEATAAGLVLTGGGANLEGVADLAGAVLHMPVRVAYPRDVTGKTELLINPAFATSIGLLAWAIRERGLQPGPATAPVPARVRPVSPVMNGWVRRVQSVVRAMLP